MLRGEPLDVEIRSVDENGEVQIEYERIILSSTAVTGRRDSRGRREPGEGNYRTLGSKKRPANGEAESSNGHGTPAEDLDNSVNIYAYGVARNRLIQAAKRLKVHIYLVDQVSDADMMVTLKSYSRKRRRMISDAERRRIPVYVLRANTVSQMESFLMQALNLNGEQSEDGEDPFESAMADAQRAIEEINSGKANVSLRPVESSLRRQQHQMARQANIVSHSYGREPFRHVRMFSTKRNGASSN
jgi:hypothetical protein